MSLSVNRRDQSFTTTSSSCVNYFSPPLGRHPGAKPMGCGSAFCVRLIGAFHDVEILEESCWNKGQKGELRGLVLGLKCSLPRSSSNRDPRVYATISQKSRGHKPNGWLANGTPESKIPLHIIPYPLFKRGLSPCPSGMVETGHSGLGEVLVSRDQ
jgi:hypothetical protein